MNKKWNLILQIFFVFLKIGPITFGGGYAMIPVIEREIVIKKRWIRPQDVADVLVIAQSVPGAIALNSATFIGYTIAGVQGAVAALIGVLLPTFLIVIGLSLLFLYLHGNPIVDAALQGMSAAIVALIIFAAYKIGRTAVFDKTTFITAFATAAVLFFLNLNPVLVICLGIATGIIQIKVKELLGMTVLLEKNEAGQVQKEPVGKSVNQ
ncbi:chromate transporter [Neobacillus kokaensis]|uniref:Chromate transporter n=2 Tax=Bacillaceae TaxID=186817 RepID=A0ABQ3N6N8_9BACI|nr:chromate transporter [Neobacillus kokaensis]GHI00398.1 chromate transporter [Neobacillus kokaensis]